VLEEIEPDDSRKQACERLAPEVVGESAHALGLNEVGDGQALIPLASPERLCKNCNEGNANRRLREPLL
jgi:hypothetical protein